ncbi:AP-3 complex subunit beta-2 [Lobulomyces angularis]|nr:AP-3 complex subunit beta-2 [Lobulomyces angularis]
MDHYLRKISSVAKISKQIKDEIVEKGKEVSVPGHFYDTAEDKIVDVRANLDSKFDKDKIDGLKRLIAMVSKGHEVQEYFPDVVKNVASSSFEVRKLVYIYLLRYCEQEPDLALLSINTFQKDLNDKNPMIRAMALRVMSSIKVMLSLKSTIRDMSPYVRKATANAIPKLYALDSSQRECLVELIETLLNDKSTIVLGSVISSFNQVCPEKLDLIHGHFRKLCKLIGETDEWGQLEIIGLLLRYCRNYFVDPTISKTDDDLELFINVCSQILTSRNTAVVLAVSQVYYYITKLNEWGKPAKSLIRILSTSSVEEKQVILQNIATMAQKNPVVFEPYLKSFFVFSGEPKFIYEVKMEILTSICNSTNVNDVIQELKYYIRDPNEEFVIETIKVIGRVCCRIHSCIDESLLLLMSLISHTQELVVAEAIVAIRFILQLRPESNTRMILSLVKALDIVTIGKARASIIWLIGQHCTNPAMLQVAPDTLRISAKLFNVSEDIVKLQVLNLAAKLVASLLVEASKNHLRQNDASVESGSDLNADKNVRFNSIKTSVLDTCILLFRYVLSLAKFDVSYDIRDRGRMLRVLVLEKTLKIVQKNNENKENSWNSLDSPNDKKSSEVVEKLIKILLERKSTPIPESSFKGRDKYTVATLSHSLNQQVHNYTPLPPWALENSEPSLRDTKEEVYLWSKDYVASVPVKEIQVFAKTKKRVVDLEEFYTEPVKESSSEEEEETSEDISEGDSSEEENPFEEVKEKFKPPTVEKRGASLVTLIERGPTVSSHQFKN